MQLTALTFCLAQGPLNIHVIDNSFKGLCYPLLLAVENVGNLILHVESMLEM